MYLSLSDRPDAGVRPPRRAGRARTSRVVVTLGVVSLLTDISSESVAAILPLYLTAVVGLSPAAYGVVDGLYQGASSLVRVVAGWSADRTGHPKWVAVAGYGLSVVARGFLLVATGLAAVTAVVAVDRIGKGIRTAPRDAMIHAEAAPGQVARAFGLHRSMDAAGAAIGPLLAFAVLWAIPDGYGTVLAMSLGFAVLGLAVLGLLVPSSTGARPAGTADPADPTDPADPADPAPRWRDVLTPALRRLLVATGGLGLLGVGDGFVYLALLDSGGFATPWFPVLYLGTTTVYLVLALPVGRLADRVGRARVLVAGHVALALAYLAAAAPLPGVAATLLTLLLLGTFYAATDGVLAALAGAAVPTRVRATGIAAAQTVAAVARMLAAAGFGLLWWALGPHAALLVVAAALLLVVPPALTLLLRRDPVVLEC